MKASSLPEAPSPSASADVVGYNLQGPRYWRSLDELTDSEEIKVWLHREFP